jgi:hypothetical protein
MVDVDRLYGYAILPNGNILLKCVHGSFNPPHKVMVIVSKARKAEFASAMGEL